MGASQFIDYAGNARPIVQDAPRRPKEGEIPVVDIANFLREDATPAERATVVNEVRDACENVGFLYLKGHGIPQEVFDGALAAGQRYFAQDLDTKMAEYFKKNQNFRGYEPAKNADHPKGHLKEAFDFSYEPQADPLNPSDSMDDYVASTPLAAYNQWPAALPGFREDVQRHFTAVLTLGRQVMRIFAVALGLPDDYFEDAFRVPGVSCRLLKYPCQPRDDVESLGIDAHCDIQCVTFLLQGGDACALQVLSKSGEWLDAPPMPGTLVVNVGDTLSRWTNGSFSSTPHRVINRSGQERYSVAVFFGAALTAVVDPVASCVTAARPRRFAPIQAGDYVLRRLARGRLGVAYDEAVGIDEVRRLIMLGGRPSSET